MKVTRTGRRRDAAINSVKILLTSASLAATFGGWAAISASSGSGLAVAQVDATATVQSWLDSRTTNNTISAAVTQSVSTGAASTPSGSTIQSGVSASAISAATATVAPTATAVPTQVVRVKIRTHSS